MMGEIDEEGEADMEEGEMGMEESEQDIDEKMVNEISDEDDESLDMENQGKEVVD
jgi:hypothetical protein